jgi:hypothetical protein
MSQFRFLILFFVLVSCHQAPPSKMQTYQKAKAQNSVQRSIAFVQAQQSLLHRSSTKDQLLVLQNPAVRADAIQLLDNIYKLQDSLVPNHASNNSYPSSTSHIPAESRFIALHQKVRDTESMQAIINDLLNQNKIQVVQDAAETSDFHKGRTIELKLAQSELSSVTELLKAQAIEINKEITWSSENEEKFTKFKKAISFDIKALQDFSHQLQSTQAIESKIALQKAVFDQQETLSIAAQQLENALNTTPNTYLLLSFYQDLHFAQPKPSPFRANLASNLDIGWSNFRQFLLDAALIWPYVILAIIFLTTILLAISSSRKKARDFQLQMLQKQSKSHQNSQHGITKK